MHRNLNLKFISVRSLPLVLFYFTMHCRGFSIFICIRTYSHELVYANHFCLIFTLKTAVYQLYFRFWILLFFSIHLEKWVRRNSRLNSASVWLVWSTSANSGILIPKNGIVALSKWQVLTRSLVLLFQIDPNWLSDDIHFTWDREKGEKNRKIGNPFFVEFEENNGD